MSNKQQINELTPEQEAKIPEYRERFLKIGLSTEPTDKAKAEEAIRRSYAYLHKTDQKMCVPNPQFVWADSPKLGAKLAAQYAKGSEDVTPEEIKEQADMASYGSFEAYWVSTYSFIANELDVEKDELTDIVTEIVQHCGVYWTFEDVVVVTPKPSKIVMDGEKLSCTTGPALEYANGEGIYAYKGDRKGSLMEVVMAARNEGQGTTENEEAPFQLTVDQIYSIIFISQGSRVQNLACVVEKDREAARTV